MPRIPESEVERLKSEVSVEQLARARGVKLQKKGGDLVGLCPLHEEETPSLVLTPSKNLWHCFGCGAGGDVIRWVEKMEGVSFRHAVELLRGDGLPVEARSSAPVKRSTRQKLPKLASPDVEDQALLGRVVDYYHETLKRTPEALEYLRSRGLESAEMVERFRLGFADRTLGYRLPDASRKEGAELRGRLKELGVLRKSGHEHLRGSLVVPLFGEDGSVAQLYGRKTGQRLRKGTPLHLYLPGPQRGVFNAEGLQNQEEVILTEAILDALTFWCHGIRNVTTTYGTSGLTEDLREAFRRHGTKRVLLAFDRDAAGEKAAARVAKELAAEGIGVFRIQLPKGMDVNEYAQKVQPARRSLDLVVRGAVWMLEGQPADRSTETRLAEEAAVEERFAEGSGGAAEEEGEEPSPSSTDAPTAASEEEPPPSSAAAPAPASEAAALAPEDPTPAPDPEPPARPPPVRVPPGPRVDELEVRGEEHWLTLGNRDYRVRGLGKNLSYESMTVQVFVRRNDVVLKDASADPRYHVDTLNLCLDRPFQAYIKRAAAELGLEEEVVGRDLRRLRLALEDAQDQAIQETLRPKVFEVEVPDEEREEALELLRDPRLLERVLADFEACGVVGEETNKLVGYLAATSRKLERPLAIVIQSSSAAGKSSLMDAVLELVPEEERVSYSAMTGQSLYYLGESDLRHKVLAIAEEEGAERASYALKLLQSEGELTIASTGKDPTTGRHVTQEYRVEGPVMLFLTTTAIEMDEELLNRCLVLSVDEGRAQTRAIHRLQRGKETEDGLFEDEGRGEVLRRHRNAQRLLRPLKVVNPYARELTFLDHRTRMRRDHQKYLTLIRSIALLHQYQREVKTARRGEREVTYIEVTREDIALADRLTGELLGRSLDELPPQTRRLYEGLLELVEARAREEGLPREEVRFTRREVREWTGAGVTQTRVHLQRLEELEYLLVHGGGVGQRRVYELLEPWGGSEAGSAVGAGSEADAEAGTDAKTEAGGAAGVEDGEPPVPGPESPGYDEEPGGGWRPLDGGVAGGWRGPGGPPANPSRSSPVEASRDSREENPKRSSREAVPRAGARRVVPAGANGEERPGPSVPGPRPEDT